MSPLVFRAPGVGSTLRFVSVEELIGDFALDDLPQGDVLGIQLLKGFDQGTAPVLELFDAAGDDVHEDIRIVNHLLGLL